LSKVNPTTGKQHWIVEDENYDYCQEIARYLVMNTFFSKEFLKIVTQIVNDNMCHYFSVCF